MRSSIRLAVLSCFVLTAAVAISAQAPPAGQAPAPAPAAPAAAPARGGGANTLRNIKVLPKTWTRQQVGALMTTFNESLGLSSCAHCHSVDPTRPPAPAGQNPTLDYALDDKPEKEVARKMIQMTMKLNSTDLTGIGDAAMPEKVSCFTCHQGKAKPAFTPAAGWARGNFSLSEAGPATGRGGARGAAPAGAPAGAPGAPAAPAGAPAPTPPAGRGN